MPEKQNFEFGVETKKMLKLMIHSLYTNKDIVVRELISNASDACDKARYQALQNADILGNDTEFNIKIDIDEDKKILSIEDNGIGMSRDDLITQLGTIAKSGTESFLKQLEENKDKQATIDLIGQFGVGFYSSFMIAKKVEVISQKMGEQQPHIWESEGEGEFKVIKYEQNFHRGTKVILYLKDDETEFVDRFHIKFVVKMYSDHIAFPIRLKMGTTDTSVETINTGTALWMKNKNDITKEQYEDFYKYIVQMPGKPWMILHNKVEGNIEFTNLLFIPDTKTYDLYNPDRRTRIKLYIKKVFITEDSIDILPRYLRFIQGIVDSEDLPLNINRETLQYNNTIAKIQKALVKKIFGELEQRDTTDPDDYLKFWNNFGPVIKEGLCENNVNNDDLLNICKFYTSKSKEKPISLKQYIDRAKKDQDCIFYICGNSIEQLDNSPQMEGFKDKDVEVLYLIDTVDDFWVTVTNKYRDFTFKSITKSNIDVNDLESPTKKKQNGEDDVEFDDDKKAKEKKQQEKMKNITEEENKNVIKFFEDVLDKKAIKQVKISNKLTTSPVCLVSDEGAMDIKLERFLLEQKQILTPLARILEINPNHKIIKYIGDNIDKKDKKEELTMMVKMLYDEACVMEGEPVSSPSDFAKRLNELMDLKMNG